jgi:hypothetical protein
VTEERKKLVITDAELSTPLEQPGATAPLAPAPPVASPTPVTGTMPGPGTAQYAAPSPGMAAPTSTAAYPAVGQNPLGAKPPPGMLAGTTQGAGSGWFGTTMGMNVVAGIVAALVAWGLCQMIFGEELWLTSLVGHAATYFGVFGLLFAGVFSSWEDLLAKTWEKAARNAAIGAGVGAVVGAISGAVAQWVYGKIITNIVANATEAISPTDIRLDLARALGWGILGLGVGLAAGIARRSVNKTVNALVGGVIGGFVGGFLFNFIGKATESGSTSRFLTSLITGVLIGSAVGLIELARRQAWLQIVGGGMKGKEFILYWPSANLGSSPKAEITLIKDPSISPYHARIDTQGPRRAISAYQGCALAVNGQPTGQHWLQSGDHIQIGSSVLVYTEKALQA